MKEQTETQRDKSGETNHGGEQETSTDELTRRNVSTETKYVREAGIIELR